MIASLNSKRFQCYIIICIFLILSLAISGMAYGENHDINPTSGQNRKAVRIVGGMEAQQGAWPFMGVLLPGDSQDPYWDSYCGASLIAPSWALTAAHCVVADDGSFNPNQNIDVIIGIHDLEEEQGERIHVEEIILNSDYDHDLTDGDIALLRLEKTSAATPIALIEQSSGFPIVTSGESTVIGWGATQQDGNGMTDVLLQVSVPVVSNDECQSAEETNGNGAVITGNMVCAGFADGGKDSCFGDSGGPLMRYDNDQWTQFGIVSFGPDQCALPNAYGVYTRLSLYRDWIDSYIGTNTNEPEYAVLTDASLYVVQADSRVTIYGSNENNNITLKSNAHAELLNFPGNNTITIQADSNLFTVSRSGAYVTFDGTDGTTLKIPATTSEQTIAFTDQTLPLNIHNGQVMLDDQIIDLTPAAISTQESSFLLSTQAFTNDGIIPLEYACINTGGANHSPQLSWSNAPTGTATYALIMDDEDSPCGTGENACKHWSVFNIPSSVTSFQKNQTIASISGATQGENWEGNIEYAGPCPPNQHTYTFTVYALGTGMPTIASGTQMTRSLFNSTYAAHILGTASIEGIFIP